MNLIFDRWIPIRRNDGSRQRIAPWQLTDGIGDNPILAVASPRPDFDGALTQFLIGLLQTTSTPDVFTWRTWQTEPPTPDELRERFTTVAHAFELEGERAFMQDFTPSDLKERWPIERILIGSPGKNAIDKGTDHFVKRNSVNSICPHCAAAALYSLQINGPAFGAGYREGLRSGGPITTIVLGEPRFNKKIVTLWEVCALNVLSKSRYFLDGVPEYNSDSDRFPWMGKTRTSDAKPPAGITTPLHVHQDQMYWPLPQRIRLIKREPIENNRCDLCGEHSDEVFSSFNVRNHGTLYQNFEHPLSPHIRDETGVKAVRTSPDGIGYRHWLGLVTNNNDGKHENRSARVIEQFRGEGRIWAFGFNIVAGQANARCWYDAQMPILSLPEEIDGIFQELVGKLINAAEKVSDELRGTLKEALFGKGKARGDLGYVQADFWEASEAAFYEHLNLLRNTLADDPDARPILESWAGALRDTALTIFDRHSQTGDFDAVEPRKIAIARNDLGKFLGGSTLRQKILCLPKPTKPCKKT